MPRNTSLLSYLQIVETTRSRQRGQSFFWFREFMKLFKPWDNFSASNYTDFTVSNDLNPQNESLPNNIEDL